MEDQGFMIKGFYKCSALPKAGKWMNIKKVKGRAGFLSVQGCISIKASKKAPGTSLGCPDGTSTTHRASFPTGIAARVPFIAAEQGVNEAPGLTSAAKTRDRGKSFAEMSPSPW